MPRDDRRRPLLDDAPVLDDEEAVGHDHRLERVVGDDEHRPLELGQVSAQGGPHVEAGTRVEGGQGLVQEQDAGVRGQGAGQGDPLRLTSRELAGTAVGQLGQAEPLDPVLSGLASSRSTRSPGAWREGDIVAYGQVREEAVVLEHDPDRTVLRRHPGVRLGVVEDHVTELDRPGGQRLQPGDDAQEGRLARSVRAQDAEDLARRHAGVERQSERPPLNPTPNSERGHHWVLPDRSHWSRSEASTMTETRSRTRERAMAASGSLSMAR